jgi:hypothetical protein
MAFNLVRNWLSISVFAGFDASVWSADHRQMVLSAKAFDFDRKASTQFLAIRLWLLPHYSG